MNEMNPIPAGFPASLSYLVLVQPMLVAIDISAAITDFVPRADVVVVQGAAEAGDALKAMRNLHLAFIGLAPNSDKGWRLAEAVRACGGRLVFIGDEAEELGPGPDWSVLVRPFATDCIEAAIKGLPQARFATPNRRLANAFASRRNLAKSQAIAAAAGITTGHPLADSRLSTLCRT